MRSVSRMSASLADVGNPRLSLSLSFIGWLCRQLQHCCILTLAQIGQENHFTVRKLERIVMDVRRFLVDLAEDRRLVVDLLGSPSNKPMGGTGDVPRKRKLRSRKNANRCRNIFR